MKRRSYAVLLWAAMCACGYAAYHPPESATSTPRRSLADIDPKPADAVFRFAAYGDTRDGHGAHRDIVAGVMSSRPSLVLQTGDLVSDSSVEEQWQTFDAITKKMRDAIPYYPARGNHDNQGGDFFEKYVPTKGVHREGFYYSFDEGPVHFVALDTAGDPLTPNGPQYKWLSDDMKKAKDDGKFIIPFYHKAIFSVGPHAMQSDVLELRPILHDLFRKYDVKLAFQGHDHLYYRTSRDGITYIVTGGGGAPLYKTRYAQLGIQGDVMEISHHFCVADVFADRVTVSAYRYDRSALDKVTVLMHPAETPVETKEGSSTGAMLLQLPSALPSGIP